MGLLNDLPHATCAARPAAAKTQYQKIIPQTKGTLIFTQQSGIILHRGSGGGGKARLGDRAKVHQLRKKPQHLLVLYDNQTSSASKLAGAAHRVNFIDICGA